MSDDVPRNLAQEEAKAEFGQAGRPTISDVTRAYQLFLGRPPESVAAIGNQVAACPTLWDLIERFYGAEEAQRRRTSESAAGITARMEQPDAVQLECTPDELAGMFAHVDEAWERYGLGAPHRWLTREQARFADRSRRWNIDRSFEIGAEEAAALRFLCARAGASLPEAPSVLTLGADAYRLSEAIGSGPYLGVEPGSDNLIPAREALERRGVSHVKLLSVPEFREASFDCDLFYSVMALQHAPPPVSHALLEHALKQVRPGGLAFVQLACHLHDYRFDPAAYLEGEGRDPRGELHALPQHHVLRLFESLGFAPLDVKPDGRLMEIGISFTFFARRRA